MKTQPTLLAAFALFASFILHPSTLHAQGSLTPPGAPAPTMKTLDQVEARTPVDAAHTPGDSTNVFLISQPGSYYLTGNIAAASGKNGIGIAANNVSLDLNGFSLVGFNGVSNINTLAGINLSGTRNNIIVHNGMISGWSTFGVSSTTNASNVTLEHLTISANGVGVSCPSASVIKDCTVNSNTGTGILVNGSNCSIVDNFCKLNNTAGATNNAGIAIYGNFNLIEGNQVMCPTTNFRYVTNISATVSKTFDNIGFGIFVYVGPSTSFNNYPQTWPEDGSAEFNRIYRNISPYNSNLTDASVKNLIGPFVSGSSTTSSGPGANLFY